MALTSRTMIGNDKHWLIECVYDLDKRLTALESAKPAASDCSEVRRASDAERPGVMLAGELYLKMTREELTELRRKEETMPGVWPFKVQEDAINDLSERIAKLERERDALAAKVAELEERCKREAAACEAQADAAAKLVAECNALTTKLAEYVEWDTSSGKWSAVRNDELAELRRSHDRWRLVSDNPAVQILLSFRRGEAAKLAADLAKDGD